MSDLSKILQNADNYRERIKAEPVKGHITLYKRPLSVGESIQLYENNRGDTFIKTGNFYRQIEIDDDGHLAAMLGESYLEIEVRVEMKKYGKRPRGFA